MKQSEISRKTNLSQAQIPKILNGKTPGKQSALPLEKVTGIPWWEFFGMTKERIRFELELAIKKAA